MNLELTFFRRSLIVAVMYLLISATTQPLASAQDSGKPKWGEWLRQFNKDKLLKPPFHNHEADTSKGLASKIRARELDVPNRIRAIEYLASLDCSKFPEARDQLLKSLNPEVEEWEEVRYASAVGLKEMLGRNACGYANSAQYENGQHCGSGCADESVKKSRWLFPNLRSKKKNEQAREDTGCHCKRCCDEETMKALAKTAYEVLEDGCCYEPSRRIREKIVEAIQGCGVPCNFQPYYASEFEAEGPPPIDELEVPPQKSGPTKPGPASKPIMIDSTGESQNLDSTGDGTPRAVPIPKTEEDVNIDNQPTLELEVPAPDFSSAKPISNLNHCLVSLTEGEQKRSQPDISANYRGRKYHFASEQARQQFVANPSRFAVAYGGCDPVHFIKTREARDGRILARYNGKYFMFQSEKTLNEFRESPQMYLQPIQNIAPVVYTPDSE